MLNQNQHKFLRTKSINWMSKISIKNNKSCFWIKKVNKFKDLIKKMKF